MSLVEDILQPSMKLRITSDADLTTKGSQLTYEEVDANWIAIKDAFAAIDDLLGNIPVYVGSNSYETDDIVRFFDGTYWGIYRANSTIIATQSPSASPSLWDSMGISLQYVNDKINARVSLYDLSKAYVQGSFVAFMDPSNSFWGIYKANGNASVGQSPYVAPSIWENLGISYSQVIDLATQYTNQKLNAYNSGKNYSSGDYVSANVNGQYGIYAAITTIAPGESPASNPEKWQAIGYDSLVRPYDNSRNYFAGQYISFLNSGSFWGLYQCLADTTAGQDPDNTPSSWQNIAMEKSYTDSLTAGLLNDRGSFDASSSGLYPTAGGSGSGGAIEKGDVWYISVAGSLNGHPVDIGDSVRALVDSPGPTTDGDWDILETNFDYVPENTINKSNDTTMSAVSTTLFPTQMAAKTYTDNAVALKQLASDRETSGSITNNTSKYPSSALVFTALNNKQDKIVGGSSGNIVTNGSGGQVQDSGKAISTDGTFGSNSDNKIPTEKAAKTYADTKASKATSPTSGDIATLDGSGNPTDSGKTFSTDGTFASNSDNKIPTEKAIKTYIDGVKPPIILQQTSQLGRTANTFVINQLTPNDGVDRQYRINASMTLNSVTTNTLKAVITYTDQNNNVQSSLILPLYDASNTNSFITTVTTAGLYILNSFTIRAKANTNIQVAFATVIAGGSMNLDTIGTLEQMQS